MIAVGEAMFAAAAEDALESQLARHGIDLYDERGIIELRDAGGANGVAPSGLLNLVANRGADVMVLIDVERMSERELRTLDRYAYATTVARARRRLSRRRRWRRSVAAGASRSSTPSPTPRARRTAAMGGVSTAVAEAIDAAWQDHR